MMKSTDEIEFKAWPKIPRGKDEAITITEKLDGTNACIIIQEGFIVGVQSRNRFITPEDDNFGFAKWVEENKEDILNLGEGYHYGEWVGLGIQQNPYLLEDKQFFLFNTFRWNDQNPNLPSCCKVVPTLYSGVKTDTIIDDEMIVQKEVGTRISQSGYTEGVVVYFHKTKRYEKYTHSYTEGKWKE